MRNLRVLLLFLLSLAAFMFTLQLREASKVQILPASRPGAAARPADRSGGGNLLEGKTHALRQLDQQKLDRAYRLGATARQER